MKNFVALEKRLKNLIVELGGELWEKTLITADPPKVLPEEQDFLDLAYRDSKAFAGYIPDLFAIMKKNAASDLDEENRLALLGILGYLNLLTRSLFMIVIIPRYHDHEDLITTINGYRQSIALVREYLGIPLVK